MGDHFRSNPDYTTVTTKYPRDNDVFGGFTSQRIDMCPFFIFDAFTRGLSGLGVFGRKMHFHSIPVWKVITSCGAETNEGFDRFRSNPVDMYLFSFPTPLRVINYTPPKSIVIYPRPQ